MNSIFPTLSLPAPFPFAGGGGWGTSTWRTQFWFGEKWGAEAEILTPFSKHADLGALASPRLSFSAGFGSSGARLRSFPSPPSREPDLAAAIFIPFLPRSVFLFSLWILLVSFLYGRREVVNYFSLFSGCSHAVSGWIPRVWGSLDL